MGHCAVCGCYIVFCDLEVRGRERKGGEAVTSQQIEAFLAFLRDCEQRYRMAEADEQDANGATQDILHSLELEPHEYHEYAKLGKELMGVRRRRRTAKDTMNIMAPVLAWNDENRNIIKSLERLLGEVRKAEKYTEGRIYTPRAKR